MKKLDFNVLDSCANFIFAGGNKNISGGDYYRALRERRILVRHFSTERLTDYVRISIGTREDMETLIKVTKRILEGI
jgi:histidinol-phosphate aminotransferase